MRWASRCPWQLSVDWRANVISKHNGTGVDTVKTSCSLNADGQIQFSTSIQSPYDYLSFWSYWQPLWSRWFNPCHNLHIEALTLDVILQMTSPNVCFKLLAFAFQTKFDWNSRQAITNFGFICWRVYTALSLNELIRWISYSYSVSVS